MMMTKRTGRAANFPEQAPEKPSRPGTVGHVIRERRKAFGWTQETLALRSGVPQSI